MRDAAHPLPKASLELTVKVDGLLGGRGYTKLVKLKADQDGRVLLSYNFVGGAGDVRPMETYLVFV